MEQLVGKTIALVLMNGNKDYIRFITTDGENIDFVAEGDCCAHAYIAEHDGVEHLIGHTVTATETNGFKSEENGDRGMVVDTNFYNISTRWGVAMQLTLRVSHNGYYGGRIAWVDEMWSRPTIPADLRPLRGSSNKAIDAVVTGILQRAGFVPPACAEDDPDNYEASPF
jgi:hypothetical protein